MKRLLTIALVSTIMATPAPALAQPLATHNDLTELFSLKVTEPIPAVIKTPDPKPEPAKPVQPPKPVVYDVVEGDNLTKIGTAHNVDWQRLWAKNTQLTHPDVLKVGDKITVPLPNEVLSREIPAAVALPVVTPGVKPSEPVSRATASYDGSNTYSAGYCTWYVKNRRGATLPNMLGNANAWYYNAAAMGMAVGSTPRAGAVGTTERGSLGHVVYVESVNGDGTITISEMNYAGLYSQRTRTASPSEFRYIY